MGIRLSELVDILGGTLTGDGSVEVVGIAPLSDAGPAHLTFLSNPKLRAQASSSKAAGLILAPADDAQIDASFSGARIVTNHPYAYFARAAQLFAARSAVPRLPGIHPSACIDATAVIDPSAIIGPQVVIEAGAVIGAGCQVDAGCFIGEHAVLGAQTHFYPRVSFLADCHIGQRGIVASGAVIGADGFGFANEGGVWIKIPQTGGVRIGDDVDIGANTTIDRGALADTIIEDGVKLDNQIQIGHNCRIGAHTAMAGCVGVAGSATIGKYCTFGGAAMVLGHLNIADHVHISSGSLVTRSVLEPGQYTGFYPLAKNAAWEKSAAIVRHLPSLREKMRALEKNLQSLTEDVKK